MNNEQLAIPYMPSSSRDSEAEPHTGYLDAEAALCAIEQVKAKTRVPCTDAVRLLTADIALAVGFADHSQFTRHFKRIVGVTPKRIRKK